MNSDDLLSLIYDFYKEVGNLIAARAPGKLRCDYLKGFNRQKGLFSVLLTIMVTDRSPNEDDCCIVFSTNAQPDTHYHGLKKDIIENGLYLVTDLCSGTGEIFGEIDEILYYPDDELSNRRVLEIVKAFGISQLSTVIKILADRYDVKLDGG
jgi:hypothetical protein